MQLNIPLIEKTILSSQTSIPKKTRLLFYLKNSEHKDAPRLISLYFNLESILLKHEAAYVLGQMQPLESIDLLKKLLMDENEIVRHKAGEALGNYLKNECADYLRKFLDDECLPVRETCYLGVKKFEEFVKLKENIEMKNIGNSKDYYASKYGYKNKIDDENKKKFDNEKLDNENKENSNFNLDKIEGDENSIFLNDEELKKKINYKNKSEFDSFDPAYPFEKISLEDLERIYLDKNECLYKRYKAMFSLRDLQSVEAVNILAKGFSDDSALFKHEIAFVFGQMRMKESVNSLAEVLGKKEEHGMVRHECAEALGAVGTEEALHELEKYINDEVDVVRESVEVALDIYDYETGNEAEYAII